MCPSEPATNVQGHGEGGSVVAAQIPQLALVVNGVPMNFDDFAKKFNNDTGKVFSPADDDADYRPLN